MSYKELFGNLFNSKAEALVNTVNCEGFMGKGIALEFRRRYPDMFTKYRQDCQDNKLLPGRIYAYPQPNVLILNFAIKKYWRFPSDIRWIESCLRQFASGYRQKEIHSVAFPWMGASNGGIPLEQIKSITRQYLQNLTDIDIEVYAFDPEASDPLNDLLTMLVSDPTALLAEAHNMQTRDAFTKIINQAKHTKGITLAQLVEAKTVTTMMYDRLYEVLLKAHDSSVQGKMNNQIPDNPQTRLPGI
jgi:O-acetyl-ADP-ribose deacetylase (regulator of RNase III)